ncbi:MAG: helix-turn-helix domain-containing protein [Bryobacteraceae bacterium]|jgi:excisionase family DNA binding protein
MADVVERIPEALTTNKVATILKVKPSRVKELVRQDILPHFRLGRQIRIDQRQLQHFIELGGQALPGGWRRTTDAGASGRVDCDGEGGAR